MKKKRGFTLVELLAVIVILAVILIIAMPKISDVIKNSKESSLETTAKLIASQAEKKYTENQVLDNSSTIKCSDVAKISNADYESCNITFDSKGNAKVTIVGKGKFEGMAVCNANKNSATVSSDCSTDAKYFSYDVFDDGLVKTLSVTVEDANKCKSYIQADGASEEDATTLCTTEDGLTELKYAVEDGDIPSSDYEIAGLKVEYLIVDNVEVKDANKCKSYLQSKFTGLNEEQATTLCTTNQAVDGLTLQQAVSLEYILSSEYEAAGLNVTHKPYVPSITITGYNIEGGTDVVIPSQIDGKTVVAIADEAFTTRGVIPTGTAYNNDYKVSFLSNSLSKKYAVRKIDLDYSTIGLGITSVVIPNTVTSIGWRAFQGNNLINVEIPSSITAIGNYAFANNPNIVITNNSSIENTVGVWENIVDTSVFINGNVIKIDDDK